MKFLGPVKSRPPLDHSTPELVAEQFPHLLGLIVLELLDPRERGALDPLRHNQFVRLFGISRFNGNRVRGMPLE